MSKIRAKTVTPLSAYVPVQLGREYLELLGSQVEWIGASPVVPPMSKKEIVELITKQHERNLQSVRLVFTKFPVNPVEGVKA